MDLRTKIEKELSAEFEIPEEIVHRIISHQWQEAKNVMPTCNTVEITGLGTFEFSKFRAENKLRYLRVKWIKLREILEATDKEDDKWYAKYKVTVSLAKIIEDLESKINKE